MEALVPDPQLSLNDPPRLRFWEIEGFFKCPVIGWCLDIAEQREVLRKEGVSIKGRSNLEIHEILVKSLDDENQLSRRIDFWLNRKYQKEIKELFSLEQGEFIKRWEASLERDEIDGILWVAVTKADLSTEVRRAIFGDVHMEMHVRAKQIDNERQRLDQGRRKNERLAETAKEASRMNKFLKRENEDLRNEFAIACRLSETLRGEKQELQNELSKVSENDFVASLRKENAELRSGRDEILKQISAYRGELRRLENQNNKLLSRLKKLEQIRFQRSNESKGPVEQISSSTQAEPPSSIDLSKKCVLVVGGLPKMEALFRRVVERYKGIFEYHDGRMGTGPKELVNQVLRADFVLCCIDHSSHTSALVVKKLCKKYKKPFRMLINSSLNNIFLALLAFQSRFTNIQNGQEDSYNTPFKTRSGGEVS
jgi:hypothetical protein